LRTVPPRPEPTLDAAARQSVVEGLVADRELANYTSQTVRYRSGLSSLPPPPEPPVVTDDTSAEAIVGPVEPPAAAATADEEASSYEGFGARQGDDGSLDQFMEDMVRETEPTPAPEPASEPQAAVEPEARSSRELAGARLAERQGLPGGDRLLAGFGLRPRPEEAPVPFGARPAEPTKPAQPAAPLEVAASPPPVAPAVERGGPLIVSEQVTLAAAGETPDRAAVRYALAEADTEPEAAPPSTPAEAAPVIRPVGATRVKGDLVFIPFAAGTTVVPGYVRPMLRHAAETAREGGGLVVVARSQAPEVAEGRARAVGEILMGFGAEAATLRLLADGDSGREEVRIDPVRR
jgi:hypothetical protein